MILLTLFLIAQGLMVALLSRFIYIQLFTQHKKTRKEIQEVKTRLTQMRKDLNEIENFLNRKERRKI
jgi:cell shape-determining protein MreC